MPKFAYAAIDASGATVEGYEKADTLGDVRAALIAKNLYPGESVDGGEGVLHRGGALLEDFGTAGTGFDTAYAALFLCSDEARFITGAILPVDGGTSVTIG